MDIYYKRPLADGKDDFSEDFLDYNNITNNVSVDENEWRSLNVPVMGGWIYIQNAYVESYREVTNKYENNNPDSPNCFKIYIPVEFEDMGQVWDNIWPILIEYGMVAKIASERIIKKINDGKQRGKNIVIYIGQEDSFSEQEWKEFFGRINDSIPSDVRLLPTPKGTFQIKNTPLAIRRERAEDGIYTYENSAIPQTSIFYKMIKPEASKQITLEV